MVVNARLPPTRVAGAFRSRVRCLTDAEAAATTTGTGAAPGVQVVDHWKEIRRQGDGRRALKDGARARQEYQDGDRWHEGLVAVSISAVRDRDSAVTFTVTPCQPAEAVFDC